MSLRQSERARDKRAFILVPASKLPFYYVLAFSLSFPPSHSANYVPKHGTTVSELYPIYPKGARGIVVVAVVVEVGSSGR